MRGYVCPVPKVNLGCYRREVREIGQGQISDVLEFQSMASRTCDGDDGNFDDKIVLNKD
jgi:hypothetical protein